MRNTEGRGEKGKEAKEALYLPLRMASLQIAFDRGGGMGSKGMEGDGLHERVMLMLEVLGGLPDMTSASVNNSCTLSSSSPPVSVTYERVLVPQSASWGTPLMRTS